MKKISLTIFLLIFLMATNVFATTDVTMEIVENNVCTIDLNEDCSFEKKIIESDLKNHNVTIQLKVSNNSAPSIPEGELVLLIDSSNSMNEIVEGETTRKDLVLNSANKLVKSLLDANPTSLKIGVVTFSTGSEKNDEGFLITGTEADAQKVCDFTNDLSVLTTKISSIEGTGPYTNLDAGLQLAKSQFSNDDNNKYLIILTDGLPNLAVGYNDLVSYNGATDVINKTNSTLASLNNINVITMLTGIVDEEATFKTDGTNTYTYGQIISKVFGTQEIPTIGQFYIINDNAIEQTITEDILDDLLPVEIALENITIYDYFPKYITDNFEIIVDNNSDIQNVKIIADNENQKHLEWKIDKLAPSESKLIKYTLSLKDDFNEEIIEKILNTNEKVDINYKDIDGTVKNKTSDVSPKIKLIAPEPVPTPNPETKPEPTEPPKDVTVAPENIPDAGSPIIVLSLISLLIITIFFGYKSRKIK